MTKNVLVESLELVNRRLEAKRIPKGVQKVMDILGGDIGEDRSINDLKDWIHVAENFKTVLYKAENIHSKYNAVDRMSKFVDDFEKAINAVKNYQMQTQVQDFKIFNCVLKQIKSAVPEDWFSAFCDKLNIIEIDSAYPETYNLPTSIENYLFVSDGYDFIMLDPENDKCIEIAEVRLDMLEVLQKALKEAIKNKKIDWSVDRSEIQYKG